jgi:hypothetical protein
MGAANTNEHGTNKHGTDAHGDKQWGVHKGEREGREDNMHTWGKPTMPCPPANDTCKQGNSKSCKWQQLHHHRHPCCSLTAIPAVTAPPAITLAPMPNIQTCHPHQTLHLPSHTRIAMPSCAHTHWWQQQRQRRQWQWGGQGRGQRLFALTTPIIPSISHQTHAMTTLLYTLLM